MNDLGGPPDEMMVPNLTPDNIGQLDLLLRLLRQHGVMKFELGVMAITFGFAPEEEAKASPKREDKSPHTGLTPTEERDLYG